MVGVGIGEYTNGSAANQKYPNGQDINSNSPASTVWTLGTPRSAKASTITTTPTGCDRVSIAPTYASGHCTCECKNIGATKSATAIQLRESSSSAEKDKAFRHGGSSPRSFLAQPIQARHTSIATLTSPSKLKTMRTICPFLSH